MEMEELRLNFVRKCFFKLISVKYIYKYKKSTGFPMAHDKQGLVHIGNAYDVGR